MTVDKLFIALRSLLNAYDSAQIGTLVNWAQLGTANLIRSGRT